jgi:hypothetical protein
VARRLLLCCKYKCTLGCFFKLAKKQHKKGCKIIHHRLSYSTQKTTDDRTNVTRVQRLSSRTFQNPHNLSFSLPAKISEKRHISRCILSPFLPCPTERHHSQTILEQKMQGKGRGQATYPIFAVHVKKIKP